MLIGDYLYVNATLGAFHFTYRSVYLTSPRLLGNLYAVAVNKNVNEDKPPVGLHKRLSPRRRPRNLKARSFYIRSVRVKGDRAFYIIVTYPVEVSVTVTDVNLDVVLAVARLFAIRVPIF